MLQRFSILVLLVLALAACGTQRPNTATNAVPAAATTESATTAAATPEETVNKALSAMAEKDQATLIALFDSSVGNYATPFADSAIDDWSSKQGEVKPLATMALGPIQSQEMQAPETSGETTRIVVAVTYQIGKADWTFSLRQHDQAWKLLEITGKTTERKQS